MTKLTLQEVARRIAAARGASTDVLTIGTWPDLPDADAVRPEDLRRLKGHMEMLPLAGFRAGGKSSFVDNMAKRGFDLKPLFLHVPSEVELLPEEFGADPVDIEYFRDVHGVIPHGYDPASDFRSKARAMAKGLADSWVDEIARILGIREAVPVVWMRVDSGTYWKGREARDRIKWTYMEDGDLSNPRETEPVWRTSPDTETLREWIEELQRAIIDTLREDRRFKLAVVASRHHATEQEILDFWNEAADVRRLFD